MSSGGTVQVPNGAQALQLTFVPSALAPAGGTFAMWGPDDIAAAAAELGLPGGTASTMRTIGREGDTLVRVDVAARTSPILPVLRRLAELQPGSDWQGWKRPSASVLTWSAAAKLALELVAGGRVIPVVRADDETQGTAYWRVAPAADGRLAALADAMPMAAHALRREEDDAAVWEPLALVTAFCDAVADVCGRAGQRPERDARRRGARLPWSEAFPVALAGSEPTVDRLRVDADELAASIDDWAGPLLGRRERGLARLCLRLVPPATRATSEELEIADEPWRVELLVQATAEPEEYVPAAQVWANGIAPLELAGREITDPQDVLVRGITTAALLFAPLEALLREAAPIDLELSPTDVAMFLTEGVELLTGAGIGVLVPPELQDAEKRRLRARIRIGGSVERDDRVEGESPFALDAMASFRYEIALGDQALTAEEFTQLVELRQPLVRWRGQWVRIDHDQLDLLRQLEGDTGALDLTEALAAALAGSTEHETLGHVEAVAEGALAHLLEQLHAAPQREDGIIQDIEGDLRDYQVRGVGWMQSLIGLNLGGVLADEMGLGKTLMAIATFTSRPKDRPHLVICPTSVVGNWEREILKFAPTLKVLRHHGTERPNYRAAFEPGMVVVTSYALMRRDLHLLEDIEWDTIIYDEAQQIKNASSKGARAARVLRSRVRFALTGTPIENRLSELWAIMDLTTPGLLGSQKKFNTRFAVPIERWHDREAAERLRKLIAPFVLRRLKDDPDVSVDLPPKTEMTVLCTLTREQSALYKSTVEEAFSGAGLGTTSFERRGRILALLTALKQICNHPRQYNRDGGKIPGRSGKLQRATELLSEVVNNGDRAIIFTQYREMGEILVQHLTKELDLPGVPFLHGGTPLGTRDAMVEAFQEDEEASPILLVSLRAGGSGLNLTRATEVLHFDRWWNPAVEQQATDRAHRIGQTRPVTVHKMVTSGTIEERIDELLERKKALADSVVGQGEAWLTELGDAQLREMVELNAEDVDDVEDDVVILTVGG
ncbi:MAG: superfamily II DNA or RNA helicase [Nonlabens sp.]|jgi:superfamily II DNA or RNA helicase